MLPRSSGVAMKAAAEVVLPDPVHEDARGHRIGRIGDGLGQLQPSGSLFPDWALLGVGAEDLEEAAGHDLAHILRLTAQQHGVVLHRGSVGQRVRPRWRAGMGHLEGGDLALQLSLGADQFPALLGIAVARAAHLLGLRLQVGRAFGQSRDLGHVLVELRGLAHLGVQRGLFEHGGRLDRVREHAIQRVVILGGNGVEFVVVAARAGDGQAEKPLGDDVDLVVDDVIAPAVVPIAEGEETERGEFALVRRSVLALQLGGLNFLFHEEVGGDLFGHED
jgi:hypothetical protein